MFLVGECESGATKEGYRIDSSEDTHGNIREAGFRSPATHHGA